MYRLFETAVDKIEANCRNYKQGRVSDYLFGGFVAGGDPRNEQAGKPQSNDRKKGVALMQ
jgi:hypothetical protein